VIIFHFYPCRPAKVKGSVMKEDAPLLRHQAGT
jgi:hypothetical protein